MNQASDIQDFVFKPPFGLEELLDKKFYEFSAKPMDLSETFVDELEQPFGYKEHATLEVNKLRGYPNKNSGNPHFSHKPSMKTYYYSRPTPQDVLIEERDWNQTNTSYSGSEIYEWNLNGFTDRQLTILVHRMVMYATICKSVNNTDRTICKMIISCLIGQHRGWWDNFMSIEAKVAVSNAKAASEGVDNLGFALVKNRENVVYTLVLTILENFNGRFTNQYVMKELKKTLRDAQGVIPYCAYTYGVLIGACTQEGINLCNELKLSRQFKIDRLRERSQLGEFCTQFGLPDTSKGKHTKHKDSSDSTLDKPYRRKRSRQRSREEQEERRAHRKSNRFAKNRSRRELSKIKCYKRGKFGHIPPNCRLEKLKSLELDEEFDYEYDAVSEEDIDLSESSYCNQQENINACRCRGDICSCENDEFYKFQSHFEDLNINTITFDNVIKLLKEVTDNNLREKIIQLAVNNNASSSKNIEKTKNYFDIEYFVPYSLSDVNNRLV
ncbi:hypothetical protein H5410_002660 [Solanum commersonii]|uniref:DUF7746 domain-containing protein n=1 Tax=Solanum commersonii TaxID=4109 RepID=A0A9J6B3I2_SOLCO|nr:hypothetical protein H5410_002660 [Solanum commersonii]